ncbi:MAG: TolC family protein [Nitrosomonadales bacterium]
MRSTGGVKTRNCLASAIGESRAAEAEHSAAELTLAGEVVDAFLNWQDIVARLNLTRQIVDKRRMTLQLTHSRLRRGIDSAVVSSQMEVQLNQEQDNLKDLEMQSGILRDRLAALTGNGPDWGATLVEPAQSSSGPFPTAAKIAFGRAGVPA